MHVTIKSTREHYFSCGIDFTVCGARKRWPNFNNLFSLDSDIDLLHSLRKHDLAATNQQ